MAKENLIQIEPHTMRQPKLGANERAIIDRLPIPALRYIATQIVLLKMRLQFTGWLQYMLPLVSLVPVFLIAGILHLLGITLIASLFGFLGLLILMVFLFDLITVKYKIRFPESLPDSNHHLDTFELMRVRHSCRSFQTRQLTSEHLEFVMKSVQLHTSRPSIGSSPIRFEYISAPLTVWPTVNATEFLVAIAPKQYDRLAVIDVGRTLQKIVMDATSMGLATCWIGPGADQSSIKKHLADRFTPSQDHIICVCAIGYKSNYIPLFLRIFNRQMKHRLPLSSLFFADSDFEIPLNVNNPPFKQFGRTYEICQWAPSSYNGQTTRCIGIINPETDVSPVRFDFYATTASRYYAAVAVGIWCANWEMGCNEVGIHGHFEILSSADEGTTVQLPRYDVSWIPDTKIAG